jgi:hypothetical protein
MLPDWLRYELREKWEGLGERLRLGALREWINEHPGAIKTAALVSVFVVVLVAIQQLRPDEEPVVETPSKEWYYDLNTGELFTAESGQSPPIKAPSGSTPEGKKAGVRAYVLSYVYEPNEAERFVGFLETTATEAMLANAPERLRNPSGAKKWARGKMIRRVTDAEWVLADSEEGRKIRAEAFAANENGETPTYVLPD